MNNWKRMYNKDGVHELWGYTDSAGELDYVDCDPEGWIDIDVLMPQDDFEVQVSTRTGARAYDAHYCGHWRAGDFHGGTIGWQPKPLPMQVKS